MNQALDSLTLENHPDKTCIGRIERGFDFLGYHFRPDRLSVAAKTIENFVARAIRLYEREPGEASTSTRLGDYVRRGVRWVRAGVPEGAPMQDDGDICLALSSPGSVGRGMPSHSR